MADTIQIFLADDDKDDCLFFELALKELSIPTSLVAVNDGNQLMRQLEGASGNLPDVLFLDLNMPGKNGYECLAELKSHSLFKNIPVVIFSTSYDEEKADQLFGNGAHYYICKPADISELKNAVYSTLLLLQKNKGRPSRQNFLITRLKSAWG